jgi:hypothetical protein
MMTAPKTYAQWSEVIEQFKVSTRDLMLLNLLKEGHLEWGNGIAQRFSNKFIEAINIRINRANDNFDKEIGYAKGNERIIVQALISLRKELAYVKEAVNIVAFPEKHRNKLIEIVVKQADIIQQSLEDTSKSEQSGRLGYIVRNNRVNNLD